MTWLMDEIKGRYPDLAARVAEDSKKQREIEEKELQEKRERIRRRKEEQERLEVSLVVYLCA